MTATRTASESFAMRMEKTGESLHCRPGPDSLDSTKPQCASPVPQQRWPKRARRLPAEPRSRPGLDALEAMGDRPRCRWRRVLASPGHRRSRPRHSTASATGGRRAVTVGYERIKGLRERGQRRDGSYEANKSKTFAVPVRTLFRAWADTRTRKRWLGDVNASVRTKSPLKAIRLRWPDGTIVIAGFTAKGATKSMVALAHTKLPSKAASAASRLEWAARLDALGDVLRS